MHVHCNKKTFIEIIEEGNLVILKEIKLQNMRGEQFLFNQYNSWQILNK